MTSVLYTIHMAHQIIYLLTYCLAYLITRSSRLGIVIVVYLENCNDLLVTLFCLFVEHYKNVCNKKSPCS